MMKPEIPVGHAEADIPHEVRRLRLLAAALELQHFTRTESNVLPIPGGDRVIAIGTPAQVRALLGAASSEFANSEDAVKGSDTCAAMRALCSNCGGTGEVHRADGSYMGTCDCMYRTADSEGGHHD